MYNLTKQTSDVFYSNIDSSLKQMYYVARVIEFTAFDFMDRFYHGGK